MARKAKKARKRAKRLAEFRTVAIGDVCELWECCREIRLGTSPTFVGERRDGWNTLTDAYEIWEVVRVNTDDYDRSIVKRIV